MFSYQGVFDCLLTFWLVYSLTKECLIVC